jgi:hypothetical protein
MPQSIHYHFSQSFNVPAFKAYEWCTDYSPQDHALMHVDAEREVMHVSESTIILTDKFYVKDKIIKKQKLVCLYPDRLSWTSTHISGPVKYSQFLYQIVPESEKSCRLDFVGLQIEYNDEKKLAKREIEMLAEKLRNEDSAAWKLLAKEMEKELREKG